jgi:hypothetical protein
MVHKKIVYFFFNHNNIQPLEMDELPPIGSKVYFNDTVFHVEEISFFQVDGRMVTRVYGASSQAMINLKSLREGLID